MRAAVRVSSRSRNQTAAPMGRVIRSAVPTKVPATRIDHIKSACAVSLRPHRCKRLTKGKLRIKRWNAAPQCFALPNVAKYFAIPLRLGVWEISLLFLKIDRQRGLLGGSRGSSGVRSSTTVDWPSAASDRPLRGSRGLKGRVGDRGTAEETVDALVLNRRSRSGGAYGGGCSPVWGRVGSSRYNWLPSAESTKTLCEWPCAILGTIVASIVVKRCRVGETLGDK